MLALLAPPAPYFKIRVVDAATGRGVPLVELRTTGQIRYVTDSAGLVAFDEPGLMAGEVYFSIRSHGYELPKDGFGYRGVKLRPRAGGEATIRLPRTNVAERLVRLTGAGIYRDSVLLGEPTPLREPVLSGGVVGQDTAQAVVYRGRMLWFWGDTNRAAYPLGNFRTTGAVATPAKGGVVNGLDFAYLAGPDGFAREMVPSKEPGPIWISGLAVVGEGKDEALYAYYARMVSLGEIAASGFLKWNDAASRFDIVRAFGKERGWRFLDGHLVREGGYLMGGCPPNVRTRADAASLLDPAGYEALTPMGEDGRVRRVGGRPDYRWQKALPPITSKDEARLVASGELKADETHFLPRDASGATVVVASGSVAWNAHRGRWIGVFGREGGPHGPLGELDYAEADAPTGPFRRAVRIVDPRPVHLLQPRPPRLPRRGERDPLRGHLHGGVLGERGPHAALRLQPDPLSLGPRRRSPGLRQRVTVARGRVEGGRIAASPERDGPSRSGLGFGTEPR